jgi:cytidylate kinase
MSNSIKGIAVSGKSGCGNTTTSSTLAHTLGFSLVNYTFRNLAVDEGLEFEEVRRLAETDDKWDKLVDSRQVAMAKSHPSVLASRLAIWVWPEAQLKVYLDAPLEIRAGRILEREQRKNPGSKLTYRDVFEHTRQRDEADHQRYQRLYGIDNDNWSHADLVIDVSSITPDEIVARILTHMGLNPRGTP